MVSRKVPVHRPSPSRGGGGKGRTVSRPGVNSEGTGSGFQSPYQPPTGRADLEADMALALGTRDWQLIHVADRFWRVKVPTPNAIGLLAEIIELKGGAQLQAMNMFIAHHMHPEDTAFMLEKMADPEDSFGATEYQEIYRSIVTAGTARPFSRSSASSRPPSITGVSFEPSYPSVVFRPRHR